MQLRQRNERIVDKHAITAVGGQFATKCQVVDSLFRLYSRFCEGFVQTRIGIGDCECRFHHRFLIGSADYATVGPRAQKEAESSENYRFARTGFAGDYVEPRSESQVDGVNQGIVGYVEVSYHFCFPALSSLMRFISVG